MSRKSGLAKRIFVGLGLLSAVVVGAVLKPRKAKGVTAIEYGLIAALIAIVIIGALTLVGTDPPTLTLVDASGSELTVRLCGSPTTDADSCAPALESGVLTITQPSDGEEANTYDCPYIFGPPVLSAGGGDTDTALYDSDADDDGDGNGVRFTLTIAEDEDTGGVDTNDDTAGYDTTWQVYATQPVEMAIYVWQPGTVFGPKVADVTLDNLEGTVTFDVPWGGWNLTADTLIHDFQPEGWHTCFPEVDPPPAEASLEDEHATFTATGGIPVGVVVDLKPGSDDTLNVGSNGAIPVAVYSTPWFDATQIDPSTAVMNGAGVKVSGQSDNYLATFEDVNGDGLDDIVLKFDGTADEPSNGLVTVTAKTYPLPEYDGAILDFEGSDDVTVVP